jgi:hypothetical protein
VLVSPATEPAIFGAASLDDVHLGQSGASISVGPSPTALRSGLTQDDGLSPPDAIVVAHTIGDSWGMTWIKDHDDWHPAVDGRGYITLG